MKISISFRLIINISALIFIPILYSYDRITGLDFASRSEVIATNGMAATSHPLATQTAISILRNGGNAIDAAIAANSVLGLVEPTGCGIGGDLFAIVWVEADKKLYGLNASGPAPKKLDISYFRKNNLSVIPPYGHLPVTIPGAVQGWAELHKKFGKLEFKKLFTDSINYARSGFPVSETVAYYLNRASEEFSSYPNFADIWMKNGQTPLKGEIFKNPSLANTYQLIAESYGKAFYEGEIAQKIIKFLNKQGGVHEMSDFEDYSIEWVAPVSTNYRGYEIWELPPNGQGIAALQILNILEPYNLNEMGHNSAEYIHLFTEAKKLVYEDRAKFYADPNFSKIPLRTLLSKKYSNDRSKLISPDKAALSYAAGNLEYGDTIYLTVADKYGNMISLIQSNYRGMGSGMVPDGLGFMLQDRGEMFSLDPQHKNSLVGGKRPFHTIIPAFVTKDGKPFMSFGLMGGAMQPQGHAQIIINLIDFKMNLQEAGDAPRFRHYDSSQPTGEVMLDGGYLALESGIKFDTIRELQHYGHTIKFEPGGFGGYQAIMKIDNTLYGASESRKDGHASGY
tara:strand:- start:2678 stop:4375 length:1698 start_codon:yes stop_codon:yes gene_type:complete